MLEKTEFNPTPTKKTKNSMQSRQLVVFINLPGVINTKVGGFLDHAKQRALRLHASCSALHIIPNGKGFTVIDAKKTYANLYQGHPMGERVQLLDDQLVRSNQKIAQSFISTLHTVEGRYEHILILGEMERTLNHRTAEHTISKVDNLTQLASIIHNISSTYGASEVWQRVQVCYAGTARLKLSSDTFANAVTPATGRYHISAPTEWSVLGKNGYAIDFLASATDFSKVISFLYKAVSNAWPYERIQQEFDLSPKKNTVSSLERFHLRCIYVKANQLEPFFSQRNAFFRAINASSPVPRCSSTTSTSSSGSSDTAFS